MSKTFNNIGLSMLLCLSVLSFFSCKSEVDNLKHEFDPKKPVTITDFSPKNGSARTRMHIFGENFGTDINPTCS